MGTMGEFMRVLGELIQEARESANWSEQERLSQMESYVNNCHGKSLREIKDYLVLVTPSDLQDILDMFYPNNSQS